MLTHPTIEILLGLGLRYGERLQSARANTRG